MMPPWSNHSQPPAGPRYWRSLDEVAHTPAFRQWVEREFPHGAAALSDPLTRRHFVKIMSASFLLAGLGLTGCRRPEENIYPLSNKPENYVHGMPQLYATAMPGRGGAQPLVVKSVDNRPVKIEGNPLPPDGGGTDHFAQASILNLYDPDRASRFVRGGNEASRETALDFLRELSQAAQAGDGEGLCFLMERSSSPSRARLQKMISERFPGTRWFVYEPVDFDVHREAASLAFGRPVAPLFQLDQAKVIVSLDCDFVGSEENTPRLIRGFAQGRRVQKPEDAMSRLYVIEALMTLTGANADHRLRVSAGAVAQIAAALASEILPLGGEISPVLPAGTDPRWVSECAKDLLAHKGASLVIAGHRQPPPVHVLAHAINEALGNMGKTVLLRDAPAGSDGTIVELAEILNRGEVSTLVILGGNPAYNAPADLNWTVAQRKAKMVVRLGSSEDETADPKICDWHLPAAHYLESWGDARIADGTLVSIQPLIEPLFGGVTELEMLARIGGFEKTSPYDIVRETFRTFVPAAEFEKRWKQFLHDGFLAGSAPPPVQAGLDSAAVGKAIRALAPPVAPSPNKLEVTFHRDYRVDDGRFNNNGWLQELPDPITRVTWENVITLSPKTARELGVDFKNPAGDNLSVPVVTIELDGRSLEAPVWVQPGQADNTVGLALGHGRWRTGRVGRQSGFNAGGLRAAGAMHFAPGARLTPAGRTHPVAVTQNHWAMEGRPIIREANLDQFKAQPDFAQSLGRETHEPEAGPMYQHPYTKNPQTKGRYQWGMAVDLNACVGCAACVVACQSENNIPIVGKDQVARGREMHWIRLDRYYCAKPDDENLTEPQVALQPMFCQHCENAPCEYVCPVNATVHDEDGLNLMVYNRCVGTRYCSNNCPYKVRRFNFFDFNQRPLDRLYRGPLAPKGMPDLLQMLKNPDVTVRMRGVMEKCTYCVQRIEQAKIAQKVKARDSGDVGVPDGAITPACAQVCPAGALVFGNISDPNSRVSQLRRQSRNYEVLGLLNTKPHTTYLARIRNPNPRLPDFSRLPLSLMEYERKNSKGGH
jgi:molybdopterin-containing oxidoreductase family iron-sulfur binding subunit